MIYWGSRKSGSQLNFPSMFLKFIYTKAVILIYSSGVCYKRSESEATTPQARPETGPNQCKLEMVKKGLRRGFFPSRIAATFLSRSKTLCLKFGLKLRESYIHNIIINGYKRMSVCVCCKAINLCLPALYINKCKKHAYLFACLRLWQNIQMYKLLTRLLRAMRPPPSKRNGIRWKEPVTTKYRWRCFNKWDGIEHRSFPSSSLYAKNEDLTSAVYIL